MGWSDKAAQPSGTILPPPPSYRRPRTGRGERGSWPPVRGQLPILAGATGPPPPPSATCRHPSGTRHTLRAPSGRRVIERGGGGLPRRRRSSSLERDSVGSTQLSPIWLRVVGGGGRPNQPAERSAGLPTALLLPTSGKDDDTEPLGGTAPQSLWTILRRQLIPPESSSAFSQLLWSVAVTWKWPK